MLPRSRVCHCRRTSLFPWVGADSPEIILDPSKQLTNTIEPSNAGAKAIAKELRDLAFFDGREEVPVSLANQQCKIM